MIEMRFKDTRHHPIYRMHKFILLSVLSSADHDLYRDGSSCHDIFLSLPDIYLPSITLLLVSIRPLTI
jgi:hypothetical protein